MAISQALIDRYETQVAVDWYEVLAISHSEFTPSGAHYMHNGITQEALFGKYYGFDISFLPVPFEVSLPTRDGEGKGDLSITFSFPQTVISGQLELALANPLEAIIVQYSAFLYSNPDVPLYDPFLRYYMTEVSTNENSVSAVCQISDLLNRSFPNGLYRGANFPGLIRR